MEAENIETVDSDQLMEVLAKELTPRDSEKPSMISAKENRTLALLILKRWGNLAEAAKAWNRLMFTNRNVASFERLCYPDDE